MLFPALPLVILLPDTLCSTIRKWHQALGRSYASSLLACSLAMLLPATARAQIYTQTSATMAPTPGAGHDYIHLLNETVNPANGSVSVNLNFPMPKGRGIDLPFSINYNSGQVIVSDPTSVAFYDYNTLRYYDGVVWYANSDLLSTGGWTDGLPFANWATGKMSAQGAYINPNGQTEYCPNTTGYVFRDMSGSSHALGLGAAGSTSTGTGTAECTTVALQGGDDLFAASITNQPTSVTKLFTPLTVNDLVTGTTYKFAGSTLFGGSSGTGLLPFLIEDRNGNQLNVSQSVIPSQTLNASLLTFSITDTLKRTVLSDTGFAGNTEIVTAGGLSYTLTWRTTTASYTVPATGNLSDIGGNCSGVGPVNVPASSTSTPFTVLSSITLPNGQAYHFYYGDNNPHGLANPYGLLSEIDYPDGGSVQYTWKFSDQYSDSVVYPSGATVASTPETGTTAQPIPDACQYLYKAPVIATRTVFYAGTTPALTQSFTYATTWNNTNPAPWKSTQVTSTDEVTNKTALTKYTYLGIYQGIPPYSSSQIYPRVPVEQTVTTYDWGNTTSPLALETKAWYDQFELACDFTTLNNGLSSGHFYQYGLGAQISDNKEYDFAQVSSPASVCTGVGTNASLGPVPVAPSNTTPARETTTTSQTFTNSLGSTFTRPQSVVTYGGGTKIAETDYGYDASPLVSVSAVQHDESAFPAGTVAGRGNLTSTTHDCLTGCASAKTTNTYDETGQVISTTDACGNASCADVVGTNHTSTYSYTDSPSGGNSAGNSNAYLTKISNALGQTREFSYNYGTGELSNSTDANGPTSYVYNDPLLRLTETDTPDGGSTRMTYFDPTPASPGAASITTTRAASPNPSIVTVSILDGMRHVTQTELTSASPGTIYTATVYDGMGNVHSQSNPYYATTDPSYGLSIFSYDALGRKVSQTQPDATSLQWCYNGMSNGIQQTCPSNASTRTGSWVDSWDEKGLHHQHVTDGLNRLVAVMEPNLGSGAITVETDYTYNGLDDLLGVVQKGDPSLSETTRTRGFSYDSLSRLITAQNPENGTVCYGTWNGSACQGGYDANGNLSYKTDANGMTLTYTYDVLNRLTNKVAPPAPDRTNATMVYDNCQNGVGRLCQESTPASWINGGLESGTQFSYDPMGRVTGTHRFSYGAQAWQNGMAAKYDLAGNLSQITYPDNRIVTQSFDGAGRLASVADITSGTPVTYVNGGGSNDITYWASGAVETSVLGNGVTQNFTLNDRLQPCHEMASSAFLPAKTGLGNVFDRSLLYATGSPSPCGNAADNNGNIFNVVDNLVPGNTQSFAYDTLNRLTNGSQVGGWYNQNYHYDSFGNMLPHDNIYTNPSYSIDPATNRLAMNGSLTSGNLQYNAAGQLTTAPFPGGSLHANTYTAEGYLRCIDSCNTGSYLTDGLGERTLAVHSSLGTSNEYVYLSGQPMADIDQSGAWTDYIYANGQKIARAVNQDWHLHLQGNAPTAQSWVAYELNSLPNYTIRSGDHLFLRQYQSATARGGVNVGVNQNGIAVYTAWDEKDQDGQYCNDDAVTGAWHQRSIDLSRLAGGVLASLYILGDQNSSSNWSVDFADMSIVSTDGSVTSLYNQQRSPSVSLLSMGGMTNVQQSVSATPEPGSLGSTYYYLADQIGSTQVELASGGWPMWQGEFTPFGQEIVAGQMILPGGIDATAMRYKFTGKERDAESGLDYFGARYYGSSTGRFMSPDWSEEPEAIPYASLANPQSLNLYSYVKNNPLRQADPDGHCCVEEEEATETGAEIGAEIGTFIEPGGGTAVGGVIGGVVGLGLGAYADYKIAHYMMSQHGKNRVIPTNYENLTDEQLQEAYDKEKNPVVKEQLKKALKDRELKKSRQQNNKKTAAPKLKMDPASVRARQQANPIPIPAPTPPAPDPPKPPKDDHGDHP